MNAAASILILEDDETRADEFRSAVSLLPKHFDVHIWRAASLMISECAPFLNGSRLISLDHDLHPASADSGDPGTGLDVARFLAKARPVCPIIIHTSNVEARWSMHNELRFANLHVEIVGPLGASWITESWLPRVSSLLAS